MELVASSDLILIVLSAEPTAFMDAYALVKVLALDHGCNAVSIVTTMVEDENSGRALFRHFSAAVRRFLPIQLTPLGSLDRKSTSLNSSHSCASRMPSSACTKKKNNTESIIRP